MTVFAGGCDIAAFMRVASTPTMRPRTKFWSDSCAHRSSPSTSPPTVPATASSNRSANMPVDSLDASGEIADPADRRHLESYLDVARKLTKDIDQLGFDAPWDDLRPELGDFGGCSDWASSDADGAPTPG